ncbi:MAG: hypothetical protein FWD68_12810 [Alphaproteobacteria bacterium]|nr:hypothetical protein [Alphaproteobacteria bacterium]
MHTALSLRNHDEGVFPLLPGIIPLLYLSLQLERKAAFPDNLDHGFRPFPLPILFCLIAPLLIAFLTTGDNCRLVFFPSLPVRNDAYWLPPLSPLLFCLIVMACFATRPLRSGRFPTKGTKTAFVVLMLLIAPVSANAQPGDLDLQNSVIRRCESLTNEAQPSNTIPSHAPPSTLSIAN